MYRSLYIVLVIVSLIGCAKSKPADQPDPLSPEMNLPATKPLDGPQSADAAAMWNALNGVLNGLTQAQSQTAPRTSGASEDAITTNCKVVSAQTSGPGNRVTTVNHSESIADHTCPLTSNSQI